MKKRVFRLLLCFLCAVLSVSMVSCSQDGEEEVPAGMQIACCAGADYRLYVPTTWVPNVTYGVSGAYRNLAIQSTVSVNKYEITPALRETMNASLTADGKDPESNSDRIEWFWRNACASAVVIHTEELTVLLDNSESVAISLDGVNARQYCFIANVNGTMLNFLQVVAERNEAFYVFTYTADPQLYEVALTEVSRMLEQFVFADPYVPFDFAKKLDNSTKVPNGMKAAFGKDVAYCFYVPENWEILMDESVYSAVASDRSSVSVVPYLPASDGMSVGEYFEMSRELMVRMGGDGGFELISDTEKAELGGRQATVYEYRFRVGGTFYHYRQYVVTYKSMIYSLTYTSTDLNYASHLEEVERMVSVFRFR